MDESITGSSLVEWSPQQQAIEVAQQLMGLGRVADWRDLLANGTGVAAGLIFALASRESWFARIERWLAPA